MQELAVDYATPAPSTEKLSEAERFRQALAAAGVGTWDYDILTGTVRWSATLEEIHGLAPGTFGGTFDDYLRDVHPEDLPYVLQTLEQTLQQGINHHLEYRIVLPNAQIKWVEGKGRVIHNRAGKPVRLTGVCLDITERKQIEVQLKEQTETLEVVQRIGQTLAAERNLQKIVQAVTDAATELTGAQFGAFFYNVLDERGQSYMLYTLSGVPRAAFAHFPMPRATDLFGPTFRGEGIIRLADVKQDPRYGQNSPFYGMPEGHLPVTSYLAVPVISRSGEVLGGLFFGHAEPGVFTPRAERLVEGLAAQAAVALDNARFYEELQWEREKATHAEQRFRELVNGLDAVVWEADPDTLQFSFVSRRAEQLLGYPPEQWLREPGFLKRLIHPAEQATVLAQLAAVGQATDSCDLEYRAVTADGRVLWLRDSVSVLQSVEGQPLMRGVMMDITSRKLAEETSRFLAEANTLLASSLDYQTTLRQVAEMVTPRLADWCAVHIVEDGVIRQLAVAHTDPQKVALARELERRYPPDPQAPYGVPNVIRTGQHELYREIPAELLVQAAADAEHLRILRELGLRSYLIVPLIARGRTLGAITFVSAESGRRYGPEDLALARELAACAAVAIDNARLFQETQQVGKQLRQQLDFTAAITNSMGEGVYVLDVEGRLTFMNPAAERKLGWKAAELLGRNMHQMIHYRDERGQPRAETDCPLLRVLRTGETITSEDDLFVRKDGSVFPVSYSSSPMLDKGQVVGAVLAFRDTTERKRAEEEVRRLNQTLEQRVRERTLQLEETNRELESFSYSVSHDLRAPLRHITGFAEFLQKRTGDTLDETSQRYVKNIVDSAQNAGRLVDELLSFSRMGRAELLRTNVDLNVLVEDVRHSLDPDTAQRQIEWVIHPLPVVQGDPAMLRIVLQNLLSNAIKYTRSRPRARIEVGSQTEEHEVVVFVRDNGVGFNLKYVNKLFGVFQRLHRAEEFEGTGIGLANVRRIISRHGGRSWAEGALDQGATFFFSLPKPANERA
jgi:PAS domain S-box-containing protein